MGKKNKEEITYIDDGSSVSDMSGARRPRRPKKDPDAVQLTKKEKRAISRGMYLAMLPVIGFVVVLFGIMFLIMSFYSC